MPHDDVAIRARYDLLADHPRQVPNHVAIPSWREDWQRRSELLRHVVVEKHRDQAAGGGITAQRVAPCYLLFAMGARTDPKGSAEDWGSDVSRWLAEPDSLHTSNQRDLLFRRTNDTGGDLYWHRGQAAGAVYKINLFAARTGSGVPCRIRVGPADKKIGTYAFVDGTRELSIVFGPNVIETSYATLASFLELVSEAMNYINRIDGILGVLVKLGLDIGPLSAVAVLQDVLDAAAAWVRGLMDTSLRDAVAWVVGVMLPDQALVELVAKLKQPLGAVNNMIAEMRQTGVIPDELLAIAEDIVAKIGGTVPENSTDLADLIMAHFEIEGDGYEVTLEQVLARLFPEDEGKVSCVDVRHFGYRRRDFSILSTDPTTHDLGDDVDESRAEAIKLYHDRFFSLA